MFLKIYNAVEGKKIIYKLTKEKLKKSEYDRIISNLSH